MTCVICGKKKELIELRNKTFIHIGCLKLDHSDAKLDLREKIYQQENIIKNTKPNLSFLDKIFGNKKEEERVKAIIKRAETKLSPVVAELQKLNEEERNHEETHRETIDECVKYWPDYPPHYFWQKLKDIKSSRQRGSCKDCGKKLRGDSGHLHHKKPLSMGGTNDLRNLVLLCNQCHQARHTHLFNGKNKIVIKSEKDYKSLTLNERLRLALSKNSKILISYLDSSDHESKRWIKIKEFTYESGGSRVWIRSHCYLRDEERTFRLDRIISASERGSTKKAIEAADYVTFEEG